MAQLDFRTLAINLVVFSIVFGIGMLIYARKHKSFAGINLIGYGHLCLGCGYVLLGLRHLINDFTSIVIANTVAYIGLILLYRGLFRFLALKLRFERYLSPALAALLAWLLYYHGFITPNLNLRIVYVSLLFATLCYIAVLGLRKYAEEHGRTAIRLLTLMFFVVGSFHVFRVIWTCYQEQLLDFMKADIISSLSVIGTEALVVLTSFATIWLATDRLQNSLEKIAQTDPLTQLYNRRTFEQYCDVEFSRTSRSGSTFSIIICDLDYFKRINDQYGHQTGDKVLKIFAKTLKMNLRKQDIVARYGGEEFIILLPDTNLRNGTIVAEHLRQTTEETDLLAAINSSLTFTASFGVSNYLPEDDQWAAVLSRADKALYTAKDQGRNRVITLQQSPPLQPSPS